MLQNKLAFYKEIIHHRKWLKMQNRHITIGNCSPPWSGGSGSAKHRSGFALCGCFAPPHFCCCWNASRSFIATAKTSVT